MTSKLTASPEVLQLCTDLVQTGGIYMTNQQYSIMILIAALLGVAAVFFNMGLLKLANNLFDKQEQKSSEVQS